jgi:hypothetical protein
VLVLVMGVPSTGTLSEDTRSLDSVLVLVMGVPSTGTLSEDARSLEAALVPSTGTLAEEARPLGVNVVALALGGVVTGLILITVPRGVVGAVEAGSELVGLG